MKKFLIMAMLTMAAFINAQETGWAIIKHEADPMLGVGQAYTSYTYKGENGDCFTFWDKYSDRYKLSSTRIFNSDYDGSVLVKVGLYDQYGNLLETFQMYLYLVNDGTHRQIETHVNGPLTTPIGQKEKVRKIIRHITYERGFVRFVAPIYNGQDVDLRALTISSYADKVKEAEQTTTTDTDTTSITNP